jgi:hypothetical protein
MMIFKKQVPIRDYEEIKPTSKNKRKEKRMFCGRGKPIYLAKDKW